ncbi:MAG: hypothetical protein KC729_20835 [Candidatus Eisenbacteria bacterium]|uniref:Uncharacterized protein n=1 Tax=Eiseniibacteriota bacterium TaxID=2212470 RepID=A0A956M3I6_UNCEI|nr:hypothetical protein [Candidatus Eisenbacteria bacterium]
MLFPRRVAARQTRSAVDSTPGARCVPVGTDRDPVEAGRGHEGGTFLQQGDPPKHPGAVGDPTPVIATSWGQIKQRSAQQT